MAEQEGGPAADNTAPNADQRIAELEAQLAQTNQRYAASSTEARRLANELANSQQANPRQEIPQRGNNPYQRLSEWGIPGEDLREAVRLEASSLIQEAFAPIAQSFQARNNMLSEYPDYGKFEADVAQHINADPDLAQRYNKMFQSDPAAAMDYAFLKFGEAKRRSHKSVNGTAKEQATEAQIPSSRGSGSRQAPDPYEEQVSEAFKRWQQTGSRRDGEAYAKIRLGRVVKDDFLNS